MAFETLELSYGVVEFCFFFWFCIKRLEFGEKAKKRKMKAG